MQHTTVDLTTLLSPAHAAFLAATRTSTKARFGDDAWRMEEPPAAPVEPSAAPPAAPPAAPVSEPKVFDEAYTRGLREEAGRYRTERNAEREKVTAAEARITALTESTQTLTATNAVLLGATSHGANAEALLDSRSFMTSVQALEADDAEYTSKISGLIKAAVEANAALRTVQVAPSSGSHITGPATSTKGRPTSISEALS